MKVTAQLICTMTGHQRRSQFTNLLRMSGTYGVSQYQLICAGGNKLRHYSFYNGRICRPIKWTFKGNRNGGDNLYTILLGQFENR